MKKRICILVSFILSAIVFYLLYAVTKKAIFWFLTFLPLWFLLITFTVKPLLKFQFRLLTGKSPTDDQLRKFILIIVVGLPALIIFSLLNIIYPTSPFNYFLRTVITGFAIIAIYKVYKYLREKKFR